MLWGKAFLQIAAKKESMRTFRLSSFTEKHLEPNAGRQEFRNFYFHVNWNDSLVQIDSIIDFTKYYKIFISVWYTCVSFVDG